jgi:hypothetical protein
MSPFETGKKVREAVISMSCSVFVPRALARRSGLAAAQDGEMFWGHKRLGGSFLWRRARSTLSIVEAKPALLVLRLLLALV